MQIQLKEWKVKTLSFKGKDGGTKKRKRTSFELSLGTSYPEDAKDIFCIGFMVKINDEDFNLKVEIVFAFEIDQNIDQSFKDSDFPKVNAPAIAFPYVRAYISNLTLQSGFPPLNLPSINFVERAKKQNN